MASSNSLEVWKGGLEKCEHKDLLSHLRALQKYYDPIACLGRTFPKYTHTPLLVYLDKKIYQFVLTVNVFAFINADW